MQFVLGLTVGIIAGFLLGAFVSVMAVQRLEDQSKEIGGEGE